MTKVKTGLSASEKRIHDRIQGIKPKKAAAKGNFVESLRSFISTLGYPALSDVKVTADRYMASPVRYAYTIAVQQADFASPLRDFDAWSKEIAMYYDENKRRSVDGILIFHQIGVEYGGMKRRPPRKINLHRKKPLTEAEIAKTWEASRLAKQKLSEEASKAAAKKARIRKPGVVKVAEVRKLMSIPTHIIVEQKKYGVMFRSPVGREAAVSYSPGHVVDFMDRPLDYVSSRHDPGSKKSPEGVRFSVLDTALADALMWVKYLINRGD